MRSIKNIILLLIIILASVIRFYHLNNIPPSLYSDEADFGYNAYSILKSGHDEHNTFLPVSLRSFGDWKSPLPSYFMIPPIYLIGLSEYSVRLPSAILGIGSVIILYYLVNELLKNHPKSEKISLISAFFLAISPWHILQSRAALPMIPGNFLLLLGVYFFLLSHQKRYLFIISFIFFALSFYDYLSFFIVTPLILLILFYFYREFIFSRLKITFLAVITGLIILLPLIINSYNQHNIIIGRAKNLSVFSDPGIAGKYWELSIKDNNPVITKLFHNKYELTAQEIGSKFLSHLDPNYLFLKGDKSPPFEIPNMGILYFADALFILFGLIISYRERSNIFKFLVIWFCIALIPAALTFQTPASNRSFNGIIPLIIIISLGLVVIGRATKLKIALSLLITFIYTLSFGYFLYQYFIILPLHHADWWNFGWKEVIQYINSPDNNHKNIVISDVNGMPYIYFLFYNNYDPVKYAQTAKRDYLSDQYGFEHVQGFDKYDFVYNFDWQKIKSHKLPNTIYIVPSWQAPHEYDYSKAIYYPDGKIAFKIFSYE